MGRHANERMYREFERLDRQKDEAVEAMSEDERAAEMTEFWERIEKEVALVGIGEWHD